MQTASSITNPKKWSGFTLLEVLVAAFLAGILLTILARVASATYRIGHEEIKRSALESGALLVAKKLELDLLNSAPPGVSLRPGGSEVIIHPLAGVTPSGRVLFQEKFLYWRLARFSAIGGRWRSGLCAARSSFDPMRCHLVVARFGGAKPSLEREQPHLDATP